MGWPAVPGAPPWDGASAGAGGGSDGGLRGNAPTGCSRIRRRLPAPAGRLASPEVRNLTNGPAPMRHPAIRRVGLRAAALSAALATQAAASVPCGGGFDGFRAAMEAE